MKIKGIDVSQWQGNSIDFGKVKAAGYSFVIIRCNNWDNCAGGVVKDSCFEENYRKAKAAGLDVGAYYYTWQTDADGAAYDAELCKSYLKGKTFDFPIYFDLEWHKAFARGASVCSSMVTAFCSAMEQARYFAGLYISRSPLQQYIMSAVAQRYALWIAEYDVSKPNYSGQYGMWQHTDKGSVPGVSSNVDLDICYVDYPTIIKEGGFNGYAKPKSEPKAEAKTETKAPVKGDLNGDGRVDVSDVALLAAHVKGEKKLK